MSSAVALRPSAIPSVAGPTRLRLPDLLRITDQDAEDVLLGRYDHVLPACGIPADERWFARLHSDDELDVWLISWVPGEPTELHDHSGSLGALTLLSGALHESRWAGDQLRQRTLTAGDQAAFPLGWVHDVTWAPAEPATVGPTLSVHAYSPPLTAMSYYEITERDTLRRVRTELTDTPEG
ncbi:MAG TPA: cysteine dioxygenase family protein [Mycobacterium sp.]|nr:cysteine dioxygenase family protein [Mycobacterium sp.]